MQTPKITGEETLHDGKHLQLKQLELTHPNGQITSYELVTRLSERVFGIVSILAITVDNEIILIRQYRAPLNRIQLEFPAGCAEIGKHAALEDAVHAELREETGYESDDLTHVAEFSSSSGMTSETVHGYVARNCKKVTDILSLDQDEYIERIILPIREFDQMILSEIASGNIIEPKMLAMMWYYRNSLAKK
jgi:ADP-ribose pyrophosphatase